MPLAASTLGPDEPSTRRDSDLPMGMRMGTFGADIVGHSAVNILNVVIKGTATLSSNVSSCYYCCCGTVSAMDWSTANIVHGGLVGLYAVNYYLVGGGIGRHACYIPVESIWVR